VCAHTGQELLASYEKSSAEFWEELRGNVQQHVFVSTLLRDNQVKRGALSETQRGVCPCVCVGWGGGMKGFRRRAGQPSDARHAFESFVIIYVESCKHYWSY
jgi:hypothetical protein